MRTASRHAPAVVAEHPDGGGRVGHGAELGQPLAAQADGDCPDGADVDPAGPAAEPPHLLDDARGVGHRVGVGHGVHGGEAAEGGGAAAGLDGLGVLPPGFAQVRVQVDEPGQGDQAVGVDHLRAVGVQVIGDPGDHPVAQQDVGRRARRAGGRRAAGRGGGSRGAPCRSVRERSVAGTSAGRPRGPRRAAGTAPPSGRRRRWRPARRWSTGRSRRHRRRSPGRGSSGPGCMTIACGGQQADPPGVEAVAAGVLAGAGEVRRAHALALDPQHHHGVEVAAPPAARRRGRTTWRTASRRRRPAAASAARRGSPRRRAWCSSRTLLRATRLCRTSPTMATAAARSAPARRRAAAAAS